MLAHAQQGSTALIVVVTLANAIGEEIFFRGALFAAIGRRNAVVISTIVYAIATLATANPMLVFAALTLGVVFGLQRRASGGILAPIITHVDMVDDHAVCAAAAVWPVRPSGAFPAPAAL